MFATITETDDVQGDVQQDKAATIAFGIRQQSQPWRAEAAIAAIATIAAIAR